MFKSKFSILGAVLVAGVQIGYCGNAYATIATYDFETEAVGTSTPFSITSNGVTVTLTSPADPGGFTVAPTFLSTLTGNVLIDPGPAGADNIPLNIVFSQPISSISLLFALNSSDPSIALDLTTSAGGSASATGTIPLGFPFPEGSLSFSGASFTSVVLSTSALDFAVDDIMVTTASVSTPEPASWPLLAAGLAVLVLLRLRRPVDTLPGA